MAVFDLSSSLAWRLGGRVRRIWFESGLPTLVQAEVLEHLPAPPLELAGPLSEEGDWLFEPAAGSALPEVPGRSGWALELFDLATYDHVVIEVEAEAGEAPPGGAAAGGRLRVPAAGRLVEDALSASGGPVAWSLEYRLDGMAVARLRGRLEGEPRLR